MTTAQLIVRYSAFALLATLANLATQRLMLSLVDGSRGLFLAILSGTAAGLLLKYILDKRWIFFDTSTGMATHGRKFTLYTIMGLLTTAIFWGSETAFWFVWKTQSMREVGAVLGITVGYVLKYNLDRKFVFRPPHKVNGSE